jgi:hypothetical protein
MSSVRRTGGTSEGGGEAGMEKPTTEEVGSEDLEAEPASPTVGRSKDAHDFLRTGGADVGAGVDADAGAAGDAGAAEEGTASGGVSTVASSDEEGSAGGGSGSSVGVDSWVMIEATMPPARSHDSDMDFA